MGSMADTAGATAHAVPRLTSWKEIAAYLRTSVRTVQRWERAEGLPIRRHQHATFDTVYAYTQEIEAWLGTRGGNCRRQSACGESTPAMTRIIVLPFRLIQADRDIDFLCFGLADAITGSLSGMGSLSVRSSMVAAKYATEDDLQRIAKEVAVDFAVVGTLLRSGDQLRVSVQLVNASSGTAVWSRTVQGGIADVFQLQDRVTAQIVDALGLPANMEERRQLHRDIPGSPKAYEYYLRANELAHDFDPTARDLYSRCVEEDPAYAPAWARLGRCCRIIAKFGGHADCFHQAEAALARALEIRPDLSMAHNQIAYLEADANLADHAMVRLLSRAKSGITDPELFAGLVHVCRYCGLLEASVAAHERACRLDPTIRTSVCHTYFLLGDYQQALETSREVLGYIGPLALMCLGRQPEAVALGTRMERTSTPLPLVRCFFSSARALAQGACEEALALSQRAISLIARGPEELFQQARHFAYFCEKAQALAILRRAVQEGFFCYPALVRDPWLNPLRDHPEFPAILEAALDRHRTAVRMFVEAGGEWVLTLPSSCSCCSRRKIPQLKCCWRRR